MTKTDKKPWFIVNRINPTKAEILIYGYISPYDISAADFVIELSQLAVLYNDIVIRINSSGGSVFEGIAMYNSIVMFNKAGKNIDTCVDGVAASMAAILAQAGKKRKISKYARMMTHKAHAWTEGDADDIRLYADMVEKMEDDIVKIFSERTGMSEADIREKLLKKGVDKWMNAQECSDMKLVDEIYDGEEVLVPENVTNEKDLVSLFDTCLNKAKSYPQNLKKYNMKKDLLKKLNLPENPTDEQIDAAVEAAMSQKESAETALASHTKNTIVALVDEAVAAKKIVAAKKDEWVKNFEGNPEGLKMALDAITPATKPSDHIKKQDGVVPGSENDDKNQVPEITSKAGEAWDKLVAQGMKAVEKLRNENFDQYAAIYKDKFKREPEAMGFVV